MHSTTSGEPPRADSAPAEPADATGDAEQSEGLRERKKRERGRALRQTALDLALENGYSNVTVEDICERCGVSRRTFFNYFASKEEALLGRTDTIFDDEDRPAIEEFESGGPEGRLLADLQHLLASVIRTRLNRREEMHQYHRLMKQDPSLMQAQMSRMGNNERLFREMIQRRLDGAEPVTQAVTADENPATPEDPASPADSAVTSATESSTQRAGSERCQEEDSMPVSTRAEALAALAMMSIKATFMRLRKVEGDPATVIEELFNELREIFEEESA